MNHVKVTVRLGTQFFDERRVRIEGTTTRLGAGESQVVDIGDERFLAFVHAALSDIEVFLGIVLDDGAASRSVLSSAKGTLLRLPEKGRG